MRPWHCCVSRSRHLQRVILVVAALSVGLVIAPVYALDIGECGSMAEMTVKLKAEGQQSIAFGTTKEGKGQVPNAPLRGLIFSANASGSVGYTVQTNDGLDFKPTQMCVYNRMTNVRIYDVRKPGTPLEVLAKANAAEAKRKCDELSEVKHVRPGSCGFLNDMLGKAESWGERVMIQGDYVRKQHGTVHPPDGTRVTITANMSGRNELNSEGRGAILYSLPEGATIIDWVFIDTKYSQFGEKRLAAESGKRGP